jgi:hypothetical protein
MHLPGVCDDIPNNLSVDEEHYGHVIDFASRFLETTCSTNCPGLECHPHPNHHAHDGIDSHYESIFKGHGVALFRQPEQRLISQYHMGEDYYLQEDLPTYAARTRGCIVRMFTGNTKSPCWNPPRTGEVTAEKIAFAKQRLREGFIFVGLTDQWDLSMCLLHAMMGGRCNAVDFENNRPGTNSSHDPYDTSELGGFTDEADGEVYQEAVQIFNENLAKYNVSYESCGPC